jgi:hypothetical protein
MRASLLVALLLCAGCSRTPNQEPNAVRSVPGGGRTRNRVGEEAPAGGARTVQPGTRPGTPHPMESTLIDPRTGLGPIKLGMTAEEAAAVGRAAWHETAAEDRRLGVVLSWPQTRVFANAAGSPGRPEGPNRVVSVRTNNSRFHTRSGLRVGSTIAEAKRLLGRPDPKASLDIPGTGGEAVWASGLCAEYDTRGTITCIEVNSP